MLDGEIEYRKGNFEEAFVLLREAVRRVESHTAHLLNAFACIVETRQSSTIFVLLL